MAGFDPDAYLAQKPAAFDPDAYLADAPGMLTSLAAGAGAEFGKIVLGGQRLVGKGLRKVDDLVSGKTVSSLVTGQPSTMLGRAGNWLVNDADQGQANLVAENSPYQQAHPVINGAGRFATDMVVTAPVGGLITKGARLVAPAAAATTTGANLLRAVETAGAQGGGMVSRSVGGAVNGAASAAVIDPDQIGAGAVIGGAAPSVLGFAGKLGSGAANMLRPSGANMPLASDAVNKFGIPLGPADLTSNPLTKATRTVLNDLPIIGNIGNKQKEAVQEGFNKAVGSTFGAPEAKLTPQVMDAAKKRLGAEFDRIWGNNALQVDGAMVQKLSDLQTMAAKLPKNEGGSLNAEIQDLLGKVQQDATGNLVIPGDVANRFQSYLRRRAEGSTGLRNELSDLRQTIISTFNRSVSPADAAALTANRGAYKAFKTVEPLLNSAELGVAGREAGDIPAALLPNAVLKGYGNAQGTDLGQLAQIGSRFVADRVARTGGSARAMVQNSMIGGALGAGALTNPGAAAVVAPTAAGVNFLLGSPAAGRFMVNRAQAPNALSGRLVYQALPVLAAGR